MRAEQQGTVQQVIGQAVSFGGAGALAGGGTSSFLSKAAIESKSGMRRSRVAERERIVLLPQPGAPLRPLLAWQHAYRAPR